MQCFNFVWIIITNWEIEIQNVEKLQDELDGEELEEV